MPPEREWICFLDDDSSVRDSIERLLDSDELRARSFEDVEGFFAHVRSHPVPLALLDVWMSNMNGLEVRSRLREVSPVKDSAPRREMIPRPDTEPQK